MFKLVDKKINQHLQ